MVCLIDRRDSKGGIDAHVFLTRVRSTVCVFVVEDRVVMLNEQVLAFPLAERVAREPISSVCLLTTIKICVHEEGNSDFI